MLCALFRIFGSKKLALNFRRLLLAVQTIMEWFRIAQTESAVTLTKLIWETSEWRKVVLKQCVFCQIPTSTTEDYNWADLPESASVLASYVYAKRDPLILDLSLKPFIEGLIPVTPMMAVKNVQLVLYESRHIRQTLFYSLLTQISFETLLLLHLHLGVNQFLENNTVEVVQ